MVPTFLRVWFCGRLWEIKKRQPLLPLREKSYNKKSLNYCLINLWVWRIAAAGIIAGVGV